MCQHGGEQSESLTDVQGQWSKETSGGPLTEKSFSKNENFFFTLSSEAEIVLILSREAKTGFKGKLGFYLASVDSTRDT